MGCTTAVNRHIATSVRSGSHIFVNTRDALQWWWGKRKSMGLPLVNVSLVFTGRRQECCELLFSGNYPMLPFFPRSRLRSALPGVRLGRK